MSHADQPKTDSAKTQSDEDRDGQCQTFSVLDDAGQLAQARASFNHRRHQKENDIVRMVEEKRDVIQLAAAGTQRLAAMNQLSAANLGMLACNATAIGNTIEGTARSITHQNQVIRKTAVAQSAATAALSLQAAAAHEEIDHLAAAMASLAVNASELLDSLVTKGPAGPAQDNGPANKSKAARAVMPTATLELSQTEISMTMALAEQTAVVARHMSDRVAALSATFQRFTDHCAQIQEISEGLCADVEQLGSNDEELDKSKALVASLVHQIEVMIPPLRQIAVSCTGVTKNLTLTAEGLDIIRNRIFVRPEDGLSHRTIS